jgi:hypothetical protein
MVKPKAVEGADAIEQKTDVAGGAATPPAETPAAKPPGFKPRFNAAMVKPKPAEEKDAPADEPEVKEQPPVPAAETPVAKPGFKPRFNAAMMKPKPVVEEDVTPAPEVKTEPLAPSPPEAESAGPATEAPAAKPVYKPKFNMKNLPKKPDQE